MTTPGATEDEPGINFNLEVNIHDLIKIVLIIVIMVLTFQLGQYNVVQFQAECTRICMANPQFDPETYQIDQTGPLTTPIQTEP